MKKKLYQMFYWITFIITMIIVLYSMYATRFMVLDFLSKEYITPLNFVIITLALIFQIQKIIARLITNIAWHVLRNTEKKRQKRLNFVTKFTQTAR